jgi:hypothetical protein
LNAQSETITVTIRIPDMSGIRMVHLCPKVKWSGFQMVMTILFPVQL